MKIMWEPSLSCMIEEVTCILNKAGVPSRDFSVQVILDRMKFQEIPNTLVYRGKRIFVVVGGRRPHYLLCGTAGHLAKMCPSCKLMPRAATSKEVVVEDKPGEVPDSHHECREMVKKGSKVAAPPPFPQKDVLQQKIHSKEQVDKGRIQQQQQKQQQ